MDPAITNSDRLRRMTASGTRPTAPSAPEEESANQVRGDEKSEDPTSEGSPLQSQVKGKWPDLSSRASVEMPPPAETPPSESPPLEGTPSEGTPPEEDSFPRKVGTNEWLHGDGRVYKKLMFVIRKDQSEALDVVLAATSPTLGEDRSEVVRNLLDHVGIKGGNEALRHFDE